MTTVASKTYIPIDSIKIDLDLYPREDVDNETISAYRTNLKALPPITVQRDTNLLIDGRHRLEAYKLEHQPEIAVCFADIPDDKILLEATRLNAEHGRQLTINEKKHLAKRFFKQGLSFTDISLSLSVSESTLSSLWLKTEKKESDESVRQQIIQLYLQCLTQTEIADKIDVSQSNISEVIGKFINEITDKNGYNDGVTGNFISIIPEDIQLYNVWNISRLNTDYGRTGYPGQIPGQIVENVLYHYTNPFDIIVDPMAGGGTTIDVCKKYFRRWRAYDIKPFRPEIKQNDIAQGFPKECNNCDLIFLDPPYYKMVDEFEHFYKDIDAFYGFITTLAKNCRSVLADDGHVAFLIQDMTEKGNYCLSGESYRIFTDQKFVCIDHISVPLSCEQFLPQQVDNAKQDKHLLGRNRDLFIFRRS